MVGEASNHNGPAAYSNISVNNIFNKTVEDARIITSDLDEFIKLHQSCSKYLEVAKEEKLSRKAEQEKPVEPVNQASTTPASSQARSDALAAQRSIQNLIGGGGSVNQLNSMDDPIMLDDAGLSFVKF